MKWSRYGTAARILRLLCSYILISAPLARAQKSADTTPVDQARAAAASTNGGLSGIARLRARFASVTAPVITSQTQPTNVICIYGDYLTFTATATAPLETNGFPLSYQWQFNGTNIDRANSYAYNLMADDNSSGTYSIIVSNVKGSASASWRVTVTNEVVDVTKDLLLIYNTNSTDSRTVLNYYLANRPGVSRANVLGIGYRNNGTNAGYYETISATEITNTIIKPIQSWLAANPAKRPRYVILFLDVPSRVTDPKWNYYPSGGYYPAGPPVAQYPSVQVQINFNVLAGWHPYVTSINMNSTNDFGGGGGRTNDCIGYINKLKVMGRNHPASLPVISASATGYGNTTYYFDDALEPYHGIQSLKQAQLGFFAQSGVMKAGVALKDVNYVSYTNSNHIALATNVAGYVSYGTHAGWLIPNSYCTFTGDSGWFIMTTGESFNGRRIVNDQSSFTGWFSANAFGGSNYSSTPIGAVTQVDEPGLSGLADPEKYFGLWASGKNFGTCAWKAAGTPYLQAIGDPLVAK